MGAMAQDLKAALTMIEDRAREFAASKEMLIKRSDKGARYYFQVGSAQPGYGVYDRSTASGPAMFMEFHLDGVREAGRADLAELFARRLERLGGERTRAWVKLNVLTARRRWDEVEEQILEPMAEAFGAPAPTAAPAAD